MAVTTWTAGQVLAAQDLNDTLASKLDVAGGKILQIVRATDGTARSTTSTSFVDVTGLLVTITPQMNTSAILLIFTGQAESSAATASFAITDNSNNDISGAERANLRISTYTVDQITPVILIGYSTPATTSATTYKVRFRNTSGGTTTLEGSVVTSQLYAIEVSA